MTASTTLARSGMAKPEVVVLVGSYYLLEKPAIDFGARVSKKWA